MYIDFDSLSFDELINLQANVTSHMETRRHGAIEELRREILERAQTLNIQPHELLESPVTTSAKSNGNGTKELLPAKYRDPASGKTWSGRGKRPNWLDSDRIHEFLI